MSLKRFFGACILVFIVFQILDFLIHGILLSQDYQALMHIWRPEMMSKMWIMYVTSLIFSFLFVYIFSKGYEGKGVKEGLRYGFLIGFLINVVGMFNQYVVYPLPLSLAVKWFVYGTVEIVIAGIVLSLVYKPKTN